ncbi:uncharacterized protein F4807DRAFT_469668 [Annulohypoxylon truncatum]|uniref:uncharacterized protein n=1 Tax=Annulohypoxylon truncatum TaxID=327061 RepID=UPI0020083D52|nr:uncharacterized protein F4807DRAFT_469668 [Annulohypoxylon truncatum]KAI1213913.1 hypothetical protein F4807DRAFT_469668 [Annulohypoxylon truncatum]
MISPIANLGPEILLEIFEWLSQDGNATLVPSVLCCRKWRPLALSVLYGDVVLTHKQLPKFVETCTDHEVRSLTLRLDTIPVNPYEPSEAKQAAESRLEALRRLSLRMPRMRLSALSIMVKFPFPFTASQEISFILDHLPACCVSLDIDVRYTSFIPNSTVDPQAHLHLCDSIRVILPQLRHLRLRLPLICPAIFSTKLPGQDTPYQVIRAPMLKTCLINLSLRPTHPKLPSPLPPVLAVLQDFARLNSTNLERLWVIDVESRGPNPHSWAAWVRRDFFSNTSYPIPVANIGDFVRVAWLARVPSPASPHKTQDWLSTLDNLETLAEGSTWVETIASRARLPIAMLREHQDRREAMAGALFRKRNRIACMLWRNEDETGEKLLAEGPGELMRRWDMNEITPSGWMRDEHTASPMVRA